MRGEAGHEDASASVTSIIYIKDRLSENLPRNFRNHWYIRRIHVPHKTRYPNRTAANVAASCSWWIDNSWYSPWLQVITSGTTFWLNLFQRLCKKLQALNESAMNMQRMYKNVQRICKECARSHPYFFVLCHPLKLSMIFNCVPSYIGLLRGTFSCLKQYQIPSP